MVLGLKVCTTISGLMNIFSMLVFIHVEGRSQNLSSHEASLMVGGDKTYIHRKTIASGNMCQGRPLKQGP